MLLGFSNSKAVFRTELVGDFFVPSIKVGKQSFRGFEAGAYNNLLDLAGYPKSAAKPASEPGK